MNEPAKHVIASANFLLGASNFIVLAVPAGYTIGQTINPNEVNATHLARGAAWVVDGRCSHWLRTKAGPSLEMLFIARRGEKRPSWASAAAQPFAIAGHDGVFLIDSFRAGFPRRRDQARLRAWWPCERTKRSVVVEIAGHAPLDLSPFAAALAASECH